MDIVIGAYWVENENNGVRSIIGELPDDVCEESGWKGLKLEKAKRLNDLADILPCPDLENEVFKLQEYLDLKRYACAAYSSSSSSTTTSTLIPTTT